MSAASQVGYTEPIELVLSRLPGAKRSGKKWKARCPAHGDRNPSLSIGVGEDGRVLLHCFNGCKLDAILVALGLEKKDLFRPLPRSNGVTYYPYRDTVDGYVLKEKARTDGQRGKKVWGTRPDGRGGHVKGWDGAPPLLYRGAEMLAADPEAPVFLVEGEKCVEALRERGYFATSADSGADSWKAEFAKAFAGRDVVILPDNDRDGEAYANAAVHDLLPVARTIRLVRLPGLGEKGDVADFFANGGSEEQLDQLVSEAELLPAEIAEQNAAPSERVANNIAQERADPSAAPKLNTENPVYTPAFQGLAGEVIDVIGPNTESSPFALLAQFLVAIGSVIYRSAHQTAEADRHYPNLFLCLVGDTSRARKGTSWSQVRRIIEIVDPDWAANCTYSGLTTGEGLIHHVRDPQEVADRTDDLGKRRRHEQLADNGVIDKRALIVVSEFASTLAAMSRSGNTLSATLREAWDRGDLRTMSKGSPERATGAHVSIVAHITRDELRREFTSTDAANGFGNRFLWVEVHRSKLLPEGGSLSDSEIERLAAKVRKCVAFARSVALMRRDEDARALWCDEYPRLSVGYPGLFGAVTSRAEAQVLRLSTLYALLDLSDVVRREHLESALALWRYCEDSAYLIFGDARGDPIGDRILAGVIEAPGLSLSQIGALFSGHVPKDRISTAIANLLKAGTIFTRNKLTRGRTAILFYPAAQANLRERSSGRPR